MNLRNLLLITAAAITLAAGTGCDDGGTGTGGGGAGGSTGGTTTQGGGGAGGTGGSTGGAGGTGGSTGDVMPTLGKQVDRMGRPAINTATNQTFNPDDAAAKAGKTAWNEAAPSAWTGFVPEIQTNLAILDSLDTVCGNQLLADDMKNDPTRYAALAGVLADDRLFVNMAGTACDTYLGVEANALGFANTDCGGRTLAYDVIDASYTILATGALDGSVGDDVAISDAAKGTTFPYLAAPNNP